MTDKDKSLDDGQEFKAFFCTACDREHGVFNPYVAQVEVFKECLKLGICPIAEDGIHGCDFPADDPDESCTEPADCIVELHDVAGEPIPMYACREHVVAYCEQLEKERPATVKTINRDDNFGLVEVKSK